jgi:hypothetical protein
MQLGFDQTRKLGVGSWAAGALGFGCQGRVRQLPNSALVAAKLGVGRRSAYT